MHKLGGQIIVGIFVLSAGIAAGSLMFLAPRADEKFSTKSRAVAVESKSSDTTAASSQMALKVSANSTPNSNWIFHRSADAMRGTTTQSYIVHSNNELDFGWPYGKSEGGLIIRSTRCNKSLLDDLPITVILDIHGQFVCDADGSATISMKFDDGPIKHYSCSEPSDGSSGVIFIHDRAEGYDIFRQLEKASKVTVEAEFFENGYKQLTFDVAGLEEFMKSTPPFPSCHRKS